MPFFLRLPLQHSYFFCWSLQPCVDRTKEEVTMDGKIYSSEGQYVADIRANQIYDLAGNKLYELRGQKNLQAIW